MDRWRRGFAPHHRLRLSAVMKRKTLILVVAGVVVVVLLSKLPSNFWSLPFSQKLSYLGALSRNAGSDGSQYQ
jgi:hypothetical protein